MVDNYLCDDCGLSFSVGWFHYHAFTSGYDSKTLLVCSKCGYQHAVEIALRDRGQKTNKVYEVIVSDFNDSGKMHLYKIVRRKMSLSLQESKAFVNNTPFKLFDEMTENLANNKVQELQNKGIIANSRIYEERENPLFGPILSDQLFAKNSSNNDWIQIEIKGALNKQNEIVLNNQSCHNCGVTGTLISDWPESNTICPKCKKRNLHLGGQWIT